VEVQNQGKEAYLSSASNLLFAASSLAEAGGNTKAAAIIQRIAAIGQSIAAFNMQMAALSLAFAAKAISAATFNFLGIVAAASAIIAIIANLASFGSFAKGGFVSKGPDSLPDFSKIPQAAGGLWTGKLPPEGMLINVHSDELVTNVGQIGTIIGALAQRVFDQRPLPALSSGGVSGGTTIVINAQGSFDSPSFWKEVYRTKIKPALQEVEYGRS